MYSLTWYDKDVPIFGPVVAPVAASAVADGEARRLFANLLRVRKNDADYQ